MPDPPPVTRIVFCAVCMASAPAESVVMIESYHPTAGAHCRLRGSMPHTAVLRTARPAWRWLTDLQAMK
jgi:hypothetical protein